MTLALTRPIIVEDQHKDLAGGAFICPPKLPGMIVRGRGRPVNASFTRLDGPTAPCVLVANGYRAHLSWILTSLGQYGIALSHSESTYVIDCDGTSNDLDGGKELAHCKDTLWERGFYCRNGTNPLHKGDGIDSYAGGDGNVKSRVVCDDNDGNGITEKSAPVQPNGSGTPASGLARDVEHHHVKCRRNVGHGASIEGQQETASTSAYSPRDHDPRPMLTRVRQIGGEFDWNGLDGVNNWARTFTASSVKTCHNGRAGYKVGRTARDWALLAPMAIGNGRTVLGSNTDGPESDTTGQRPPNIWVLGKRGRIVAPILSGAGGEVWDDAELEELAALARYGIWFTKDADDVDVIGAVGTRHLGGNIRNDATGVIRVNGQVLAGGELV